MSEAWNVCEHLLVRAFVPLCELDHSVKHEHLSVMHRLENQHVLKRGPFVKQHFLHLTITYVYTIQGQSGFRRQKICTLSGGTAVHTKRFFVCLSATIRYSLAVDEPTSHFIIRTRCYTCLSSHLLHTVCSLHDVYRALRPEVGPYPHYQYDYRNSLVRFNIP